jgi:hypothetical protein
MDLQLQEHRFAIVTRAVAGVSRRTLLGGLTALGLGLGAAPLTDTVTAKKKRKKRKPRSACRPGQVVDSIEVPSTGLTVVTKPLEQGRGYRLRASGFWRSNATHGQDAFADFELADPTRTVTTFMGVRLGLAVDDGSADQWGEYTTTHVYERAVAGEGKVLALTCSDVVHADNVGTLRVEVICA